MTEDITQVVGYRLPTEAEWEYAARGGHKSAADYKYAGSDDVYEVAWFRANRPAWGTRPVGEKNPNELGLYDMIGNVWEWCHDRYERYSGAAKTNPSDASSGSYRVMRGGGWNHWVQDCRVASRSFSGVRRIDLGLHLARTCP